MGGGVEVAVGKKGAIAVRKGVCRVVVQRCWCGLGGNSGEYWRVAGLGFRYREVAGWASQQSN